MALYFILYALYQEAFYSVIYLKERTAIYIIGLVHVINAYIHSSGRKRKNIKSAARSSFLGLV